MSDSPEVHEGVLDHDGLAQWQRDLELCAEVHDVRVKMRGAGIRGDQAMSLQEAVESMRSGDVGAMQVRYRFEGETWCDTMMPFEDGVRVIRTRLADPA